METVDGLMVLSQRGFLISRIRTAWLSVLCLLASAVVVQAKDYRYTTNSGTITIAIYLGPGGAVTIPSTTNGLPVTSIGDHAFYYACSSLTNVTIPNSVTNIDSWAFCDCSNLTSVTIGTNVSSIGSWAFGHCTSLTSVTIPNSVTSIGDRAFYDCSNLTNVTIGTNVTTIGIEAFYSCTNLTSVTIPNSVTSIGYWAFGDYTGLTSVPPRLEDRVFELEDRLFNEHYKATIHYLPSTTGWSNSYGGRPTAIWNPHTNNAATAESK